MLEEGTIIELQLPGQEAPTQAKVLSCSATMQSVRLQELDSEEVHRLSLKKLPYTIVSLPSEQQPAEAAGQPGSQQQADQQQQQQQEEEGLEDAGGSSEEEEKEQQEAEDAAGGTGGTKEVQQAGGVGEESGSEEDEQGGSEGEDDEDEEVQLDVFPASTAAAVEAFAVAVEADPAAFLQPTLELAALAKSAAKALYDYQAALESEAGSSGGSKQGASGGAPVLPELYVEGFDAEQIWLQLELAAGPALKRARKLLKKAGEQPELLTPETEEAIDELLAGADRDSDAEGSEGMYGTEEEEEEDGSEDEEGLGADVMGVADLADIDYDALLAAGAAHKRRQQQAAGGSDSGEEEDEEGPAAAQLAGSKRKRSALAAAAREKVEDEHFKLDEMEAFVQQAEREAAGLDEEGEEADDDEGAGGSEDEEAALEALLEQAAAQTGRVKKKAKKARKKKKVAFGDAVEEEDEDGENVGASAMFEDFFGPRRGKYQGPTTVAAGSGRRLKELQEADDEDKGSDEQEEDEGFEDDLLSEDIHSGEEGEDDEEGGRLGRQQHDLANGRAGEDSEEDELDGFGKEDEEDEHGESWGAEPALGSRRALLAESDEEEEDDEELAPSAHAKRQQRMQDKIRKLEEAAMGDKEWFMRGEVDAGRRPKNSALEVDLDFETTVKPPPQPTEEMTQTLDELIKKRIAEGRFDDVVRIVAPPPEKKRTTLELDDSKPQQGLGEIYEQEYMQAVTGAADDKDEDVRQAARAQFSALCAKLDALSHLHFTPRPVIEEVTVKVDVPAIMMEEAAPQFVSGASLQAPEEVFATGTAGAPRAEEELDREDRKRRRAQKKRAGKKRRAAKDEDRAARAVSQGGTAPLVGRKSAAAEEAARKMEKASKKQGSAIDTSRRGEYSKSASVFAKIMKHADGTTAAAAAAAAAATVPRASHLKL